jgi:hypothetical protein
MLESTVEYHDEQGLADLVEANQYRFDFGVKNGFVLWGINNKQVEDKPEVLQEFLRTKKVVFSNSITTIYDLILDLVDKECYYLDYNTVPSGDEDISPEGKGVAKFSSLEISKSTMTVYFSVVTDEGFRTRTVIRMKDGIIELGDINIAINESDISYFESKYPLEFLTIAALYGKRVGVFRLKDGLSIYPLMTPYFKLFDPVLNYKIYQAECSKVAADFLEHFVTATLNALFPKEEEEVEEFVKEQPAAPVNEDRKYGVLFKLKYKAPTVRDREVMLNKTIWLFEKAYTEKLTLPEIMKEIKKFGFDSLRDYACIVLLQALATTNTGLLDRVECAKTMRTKIKQAKLKQDLELFVLRSYIYFGDYKLPYGADSYEIAGGNVPFISVIQKKLKRW